MTIVDIRNGLRGYLLGSPEIAAVVAARVYPLKMPQGQTLASIVYTRISGQGNYHNGGPSGLARPRIQIDCWAPTADAASSLALLVKEKVDGFRGTMAFGEGSPQEEITVRGIFFDNEREDYDDATKLCRVSQDYFIWYAER